MSSTDYVEIETLINDCWNTKKKLLTEWEYDFLASMDERLHKKYPFTDKQIEMINKIWERVT
jgi:hypothetical protein